MKMLVTHNQISNKIDEKENLEFPHRRNKEKKNKKKESSGDSNPTRDDDEIRTHACKAHWITAATDPLS
jgi:hypothetical protein